MEPIIRNYQRPYESGRSSGRLISLEDNPPTCTMSCLDIEPGKSSPQHIHPWEHEFYILEGAGVLVCDGHEYPVREGDGVFIPGDVNHSMLNNNTSGVIRCLDVTPVVASQRVDAGNQGGTGSGKPPVIRNYRELDTKAGHVLLGSEDGAPNYLLLYNGPLAPGAESRGHAHQWEHLVYILRGEATLICGGKNYAAAEGDAVLVPPNVHHHWKNETQESMLRLTFNPLAWETREH